MSCLVFCGPAFFSSLPLEFPYLSRFLLFQAPEHILDPYGTLLAV